MVKPRRSKILIALSVVAMFAVLVAWKAFSGTDSGISMNSSAAGGGDSSITSVRNDAVADYDVALAAGKPMYVLFHSLTCVPCVEISEVADKVVPEYEDGITFVNVITDDPSGKELARRFEFQYIPTSFFLASDGTVIDSYTGAMDEAEMRGRLDALVGSE